MRHHQYGFNWRQKANIKTNPNNYIEEFNFFIENIIKLN